jgi:hypothetical protein
LKSNDLLTNITLIGGFFGGLRFSSIVFCCSSLGEGSVVHVLSEIFVSHVVDVGGVAEAVVVVIKRDLSMTQLTG